MNPINEKILNLIYFSIVSEGGDGDALWLSKHTSMSDLVEDIKDYNLMYKINWTIEIKDNHLLWGENQEWAIITNDETFFKSQPDYIILKINY